MGKMVPIKLHTSNALRWLGSLYRNPADALKEHVSNAIDEHMKAMQEGNAAPACEVRFVLEKKRIVVEYPYGMSKEEFANALQRVADSAKRRLDYQVIGRLGIGMFSFLQIGRKCVFYTKKGMGFDDLMVTLREGSDQAEFETPKKQEAIANRGIRIVISELHSDFTRPRAALSPPRLQHVFAEKFDKFLRSGMLRITVRLDGKDHEIVPLKIDLPRIAAQYREWRLPGEKERWLGLDLYFDPSGKGKVSIRHMGVVVVDSIAEAEAYGLEESVYAGSFVKGFIDADFLTPLPARTGFEENDDWIALLAELDRLRPIVEEEIETLRMKEAAIKLAEVQKKAIEVAREILNLDDFGDLELLEGLGKKKRESSSPPNGFAFSPSSIRIEEGRAGRLSLKAMVPAVLPDNSLVRFSVDDPDAVELKTTMAILRASEASARSVVTTPVRFVARSRPHTVDGSRITKPIVLVASAGHLKADARIRIGEFKLERPRQPLSGAEGLGQGINYREIAFEDGARKHSRYVARVIEINELNEDYKKAVLEGTNRSQLAYAAMMIGKETIAFNDKTGSADEYLEKLLSFYFRMMERVGDPVARRR